jgi:site-specific DNA-methyltransferase (adenine-specific)
LRSLYQAAGERENRAGRTGGIILIEMLHTDCMDYMATLPDKAFDLAIVDPPYGLRVDGVNPIANKSGDQNHNYDHSKQWDDSIPDQLYFTELIRVSKNQIIWGGNYFLDYLGFCKAPIIWDKLNGESMFADGEMAWTSAGLPRNLKIFRHQWCGAFKDSERGAIKIHPTQKPVALYKWLLSRYAKPGDKILDTHGGSGSICIACHDLGYDLTWMELDADYYKAAVERYQNHAAQATLFEPAELTKETQGDLF